MKGKTSIYFAMPNLGRLRSRIEAPSKTLTSELRSKLTEIVVKVLNDSNLKVRSEFIAYIETRTDLKFKSAEHKKQVMNLFSGIFDAVFAVDAETLNALVGDDDDDNENAGAEAEGKEETKEEKGGKKKGGKAKADAGEAPEPSAEAAADPAPESGDEFEE